MKERRRENCQSCYYLVYRPIDVLDYLMEGCRGILFDPLGVVLSRSFRYLKGLRYPKQLKERKLLQLAKDPTSSQYCMCSPQLSFFDRFSCLNGVPAYCISRHDVESIREEAAPSSGVRATKVETRNTKDAGTKVKKDSAFKTPSSEAISVCCFSSDGSKFAVCYVSGDVTIWDSYHGSLVSETHIEDPPATNVSFLENRNSALLICTKAYTCWKWDTDNSSPILKKICDFEKVSTTMEEILDGDIISQRSYFCMNETKLALSTIIDVQERPLLDVTLVNTCLDPPELTHLSPVKVERHFVISSMVFSPDGKGLLVSLIDQRFADIYSLLWPNFNENPTGYEEFDKATVGSWSNDSRHVVTWIMTNKPNLNLDDKNSSFVWNVEEMRENSGNIEYSLKHKRITNPFGDKVFWCQLTKDMDENDRLITGIIGKTTRFLFIDLASMTHTHIIETEISAKDMILWNGEAWIQSYVAQKTVKGLSPMSVTKDGSMFGAVLGWPSEIIIWDACLGIEILKIAPTDLHANQFKGGIDLMASLSCRKFAIVGSTGVMVLCPSTPSIDKRKTTNCLETQMVQFDNPHVSQDNLSMFKTSFSGDGDTLGVLCIGLSKMQVWNLPQGTICTIKSTQNEEGRNIQDFCLSNNGQYLAINIGKSIQIMDCKAKDVAQTIGVLDTDLKVVSMGINDYASELVLCMEDGSIDCYELSHEDAHYTDEAAPSTSIIHEFAGHRLSMMERITSWFKRPSAEVNEPLIDNNEGNDQPTSGHISLHIPPNANLLKHTRHVLSGELDDATFQVSPNFKDVIRISESQGVEAWDLETKMKLFGPFKEISFIERKAWVYSDVSSITEQVHNELKSREGELLGGPSIDLSKQTTIVQSSRENIVVAGTSSLQVFSQQRDEDTFDLKYREGTQEDSTSIYVINLKDVKYRRRLSGKNLEPRKGMAISHDGRYVACLTSDFGSKVVVWNVFASEGLVPDYHALALNYDIKDKEAIKREIVPMIDVFGSNFFNFKHAGEMSILDGVVRCSNTTLLKTILKYALKKEVKVSFLIKKKTKAWTQIYEDANYMEACIVGRSPKTLQVIVQYLLRRVCHEHEIAKLLTRSLLDSLREYPQIFLLLMQDPRLLGHKREIEVTHDALEGHKFVVKTSKSLKLSEEETRKYWTKDCEANQSSNIGSTPCIAGTLPYKGACNIGSSGLLRKLIMNRAQHCVFRSFAIGAIVEYKWRTYARRFFVHELCHHSLVALSFSVYCFVLCTEGTYKMGQSSIEDEEDSTLTLATLKVCLVLAIPCLIRELRQCVVYIMDYKLRGLVFWLKSGWNWIELLSYLNLIFVVPLEKYYHLHEGKNTTKLSAVVAVESLLLWNRMLFYARPFSSTGPLVTTITSIVRETVSFLVLALCVMFGFALAFRVLYRHVECIEEDEGHKVFQNIESNKICMEHMRSMHASFGTFKRSFFTVFGYTFGNFEMDVLYNAPEMVTATILFVLYVVIIAIIFLNMLIALMSNKFARIYKNRRTRVIEARAKAIDDIDSMLSYVRKKKLSGKIEEYLHVAIPSLHHERTLKPSILRPTLSQFKKQLEKKKTKKKPPLPSRVKDRSNIISFAESSQQHAMRYAPSQEPLPNIPEIELADQCGNFDREMDYHWYDSESSVSDSATRYSDEDHE